MKRSMILMSGVAAVLVAGGCRRAVDTRDAEEKVKNIAEATMKSPVASVRCPEAERNAGVAFSCDVTFVEGGTHKLKVVITDNHGNFLPSWEVPIISMTRLAESIAETTRIETGAEARVTCGEGVRPIAAEAFPCTVSVAGADRAVAVRVDPGDASWELIER